MPKAMPWKLIQLIHMLPMTINNVKLQHQKEKSKPTVTLMLCVDLNPNFKLLVLDKLFQQLLKPIIQAFNSIKAVFMTEHVVLNLIMVSHQLVMELTAPVVKITGQLKTLGDQDGEKKDMLNFGEIQVKTKDQDNVVFVVWPVIHMFQE